MCCDEAAPSIGLFSEQGSKTAQKIGAMHDESAAIF
jgi:hypothetical protein